MAVAGTITCCVVAFAETYPPAAAAPVAAAPTSDAPPASDPIGEKSLALKEAAALLDKAGAARTRGARSFAEQLFSSAEVLVGPEAVSSVAPLFRVGAPPRVTTPTVLAPKDSAPQPASVGGSEQDEPEEKPKLGRVSGSIAVEGGDDGPAFGFVTLEPAAGKFRKRSPRRRTMEQRARQFAPRLLVVPVGSTVTFPNFDPVYHNVFSTSDLKAFDLGIYRNGEAREVVFDKEGIVKLGCNLHANMSAHIVVVSAPHYVVTDEKGRFAFNSLAPGKYKLRAWSERSLEPVTQLVDVKADKNTFVVKVKSDAPTGPMADKFGVSRGAK